MEFLNTPLSGVIIIEPDVYQDDRGYFMETFNHEKYQDKVNNLKFVQDNLSFSKHATLRGLHFQIKKPQAKLIQVLQGKVFDVVVDIRYKSTGFGNWTSVILSEQNKRQLFIPEGFAHGFCVLSETALFSYKCSDFYDPKDESGIIWNDKDLAINWPVKNPAISKKDNQWSCLSELGPDQLPDKGVSD